MSEEKKNNPNHDKEMSGIANAFWLVVGIILIIMLFHGCSGNEKKPDNGPVQESTALVLCRKKAKAEAPYGFKSRTLDTDIAHRDGKVIVTFHDAEVGTALGATKTQTIECDVSGTNSVPTIEGFGAIE
ncbi:hypothetical protein [Bifidobacterium bombi]|uniref:Uncharacterized protein n=1 Tax=Bifidobacterium bombi DSM 19703 TaxID=1341695 RepID=A0A080N2V1_9BIFI|nr:hypothetical protein [Bifidobacterium bombi]KFF31216.1 hypothetical protein BBOMB_0553 [Bifidobacterium bombi DSM 19703]